MLRFASDAVKLLQHNDYLIKQICLLPNSMYDIDEILVSVKLSADKACLHILQLEQFH